MKLIAPTAVLFCWLTCACAEPLPEFAVARLGSVRWRGLSTEGDLCYTGDGKAIVCLMSDGSLAWHDRGDGRELRRIREPKAERIQSFALSADGRTAVTVNNSYPHGRPLADPPIRPDRVVTSWDLRTGKAVELRAVLTTRSRVSLAGNRVAFARSNELSPPTTCTEVLDVELGEVLWTGPQTSDGICRDLSLREDGGLVIVEWVGSAVRVSSWDTRKDELRSQFEIAEDDWTFRLSPDGLTVAAFGSGERVFRWDTRTGARMTPLQTRHGSQVTALAYSRDSRVLFTAGADGAIRWWDAATGAEIGCVRAGQVAERLAVAPTGDELAVVFAGETTVRRFYLTTKVERPFPEGHRAGVSLVSFASDNTIVTVGADRTVRRWNRTGSLVKGFDDVGAPGLQYLGVSADGNRVVGVTGRQKVAAEGEKIEVWDLSGRPNVRIIRPEPKYFVDLALMRDGSRLLTRYTASFAGHTSRLELWDVDTGRTIWRGEGQQPNSNRLLVEPTGQIAWGRSFDGTWHRWDASSGRRQGGMTTHTERAALSVDGRMLVGPEPNGLYLELIETLSARRRLRLGRGQPYKFMWDLIAPTFIPDGRLVAARDNEHPSQVIVWDLATSEAVARLNGHGGDVTHLAASPDGALLASGSVDATVMLWNLAAIRAKLKPLAVPDTQTLPALWANLGDVDAERAYRSVVAMQAIGPPVIAFLRARLKRAAVDEAAVDRWITELDAREHSAREAAEVALAAVVDLADVKLRKALERSPSLEAQRRVERLLKQRDGFEHAPQRLRALRAVEVLENIGGQEARNSLADLAAGHPSARLTQEAAVSLRRMPTR